LRSQADVCSYRPAAERLNPPHAPAAVPPPPPTPAVPLLPPTPTVPPNVRADSTLRPQGRGGRECVRPSGRPCPHGRWGASARTPACPHVRMCMSARTAVFSPCNFKTDSIVRPSHGRPCGHRPIIRPSVRYRPRDNHVVGTVLVWVLGLVFYLIEYGIEYRFQTYHASEDHQYEASFFIEKVYALRSEADVCSYRPAAEMLKPAPYPCCSPTPTPYPCCSSPASCPCCPSQRLRG
jgi:hypothetical protein